MAATSGIMSPSGIVRRTLAVRPSARACSTSPVGASRASSYTPALVVRSTPFTRATILNQSRLRMTPCAASESATAEKRAWGGTVPRWIGRGAGGRQALWAAWVPAATIAARSRPRGEPRSARTGPPGIEKALEQHRGREGVDVLPPAAGRAFLLSHQPERAGGAEPLVLELDREPGAALYQGRDGPGLGGTRPLVAGRRERQAHDHAHRRVGGDQLQQPGHGEALAPPADQGLEGRRQHLELVAEGEADADLAPVDGKDPAVGGDHAGR